MFFFFCNSRQTSGIVVFLFSLGNKDSQQIRNFNSTNKSVSTGREKMVVDAAWGGSLAMGSPPFDRAQPRDPWLHARKVWAAGVCFISHKRSGGWAPVPDPRHRAAPHSLLGEPRDACYTAGAGSGGLQWPSSAHPCTNVGKWNEKWWTVGTAETLVPSFSLKARSYENETDKKQFLMGHSFGVSRQS